MPPSGPDIRPWNGGIVDCIEIRIASTVTQWIVEIVGITVPAKELPGLPGVGTADEAAAGEGRAQVGRRLEEGVHGFIVKPSLLDRHILAVDPLPQRCVLIRNRELMKALC